MLFTTALTLLSVPFLAAAQYGYGAPDTTTAAPTTTSPAAATTAAAAASAPSAPANSAGHVNVNVAPNQSLTFNPPSITAPNGTVVTFYFPAAVAHSVTQSSFANPCTYLAANGSAPAGFDSGLNTEGKQFSITITDDAKPIWFYCKQAKHCGAGMVGAINAPTTGNTFTNFQAAAMAIGSNQTPTPDNGPVTGGVNGQATAAPANTAAGASSTAKSGASGLGVNVGAALLALVALFA
jgi:plastocyanin